MMHPTRLLPALLCAAMITGCAPLITQSPGEGLSPVNAVADGADKHLMLFGYDVVSYFTDHRDEAGSPAIKSVYKDVTFRFAIAEHKALFDAAPQKYIPQFGGYCANGIVYAIPWGGDADVVGDLRRQALHLRRQGCARRVHARRAPQPEARGPLLGRGGERLERVLAARQAPGLPRAALQERRGARRGGRPRAARATPLPGLQMPVASAISARQRR